MIAAPKIRGMAGSTLVVAGVALFVPGSVCAGLFLLVSLVLMIVDRSVGPLAFVGAFVLPGTAVAAAGIGLVRFGTGLTSAASSADHDGEPK